MAEYVASQEEFERIKRLCHSLVRTEETLPAHVFRTTYNYYRFADFSGLFTSRIDTWDSILTFAGEFDAGPLSLLMLDPLPESYHSWSGKHGAIMIRAEDQVDDIMEILSVSPDDSVRGSISADGIVVIGNRFVVCSESSPDWCLWADRHHEVAIMGLSDYPTWMETKESWTEIWCDVHGALEQLFPLAFWPRHVPEDFRRALLANY